MLQRGGAIVDGELDLNISTRADRFSAAESADWPGQCVEFRNAIE